MIGNPLKGAMRAALWLAGLLALYGLAALACALVPVSGRPQVIAAGDRDIFVCASMAHTDIVVPIDDDAADWPGTFAEVTSDVPQSADLAIGWGDLGVYHDTPAWRDLRPGTALRALAGLGPTTLHVIAVAPPADADDCVEIAVDHAGRQALARFIVETAETDPAGHPRLIDAPRVGEAFYAAKGRYSPWRTCNAWASEALAKAGMPVARWAPFSFDVTWPLMENVRHRD
jgi:uncharacterized protein (TIGR02117 family)